MKTKLEFAKSHFKYRFLSIRVRRRVGQVKEERNPYLRQGPGFSRTDLDFSILTGTTQSSAFLFKFY